MVPTPPQHLSLKQCLYGPRMGVPSPLPRLLWVSYFRDPTKRSPRSRQSRGRSPVPGQPILPGPGCGGLGNFLWGARGAGALRWVPPAPCRLSRRTPSPRGRPLPGGSWRGRPARPPPLPGPRTHALTESREPPSCAVDALAAVSLGSTERQQPLAVTGAKRRQRRRGPGSRAGRRRPRGSAGRAHLPPLWPGTPLARRRSLPPHRVRCSRSSSG